MRRNVEDDDISRAFEIYISTYIYPLIRHDVQSPLSFFQPRNRRKKKNPE